MGSAWIRRGTDYERLKDRLTEELLGQVFGFRPQLEGRIDHTELATPRGFNHFLGRERGEFMSLARTLPQLHEFSRRVGRTRQTTSPRSLTWALIMERVKLLRGAASERARR